MKDIDYKSLTKNRIPCGIGDDIWRDVLSLIGPCTIVSSHVQGAG